MSIKGKLTNKQVSAMGIERMDNGKNTHEKDIKERQRKNDNVKPD